MKKQRHETAQAHVVAAPIAFPGEQVGVVRRRLDGAPPRPYVYVVDGEGRYFGHVPVHTLFALSADAPMAATSTIAARSLDDQERVASLAVHHFLEEVPVIDDGGRFQGVVPALAIMQILRHEHIEDLHKLAGIRRETAVARHAMEAPPMRSAADRLPWLLVGLAGSCLATAVMAGFEDVLESRVEVALFIPGIVYIADAIGTQTEAIAVRGLSLAHAPVSQLVLHEAKTGTLIGLALSSLVYVGVSLVWGTQIGLAVAIAVLCAGMLAAFVGVLFPWALSHAGRDPALGSGPVATILQDVMSLLLYFWVVQALL